jgi:hypothetical protein
MYVLDEDGNLYFCFTLFICDDFWEQFVIQKINDNSQNYSPNNIRGLKKAYQLYQKEGAP